MGTQTEVRAKTKEREPSLLRVGLFFSAAYGICWVVVDTPSAFWFPAQLFIAGAAIFAATVGLARGARVDVRFFPRDIAPFWTTALKMIVWGAGGAAAIFGLASVLVPSNLDRAIHIIDFGRARAAVGAHPAAAWLLLAGWMMFFTASEEVFFRGIVLTRLRSRFGTVAAVVLSSTWFALGHFPLQVMPYIFAMGLVFAGIRVATDGLGASCLAHWFWNMFVLYMLIKK